MMTPPDWIFAGFVAATCITDVIAACTAKRAQRRQEAAVTVMREQLQTFDVICQAGGDAQHLFVRHREGTDSTWVDLVMTLPGLSLRMPIRPEEMEGFISELRGQPDGLS